MKLYIFFFCSNILILYIYEGNKDIQQDSVYRDEAVNIHASDSAPLHIHALDAEI